MQKTRQKLWLKKKLKKLQRLRLHRMPSLLLKLKPKRKLIKQPNLRPLKNRRSLPQSSKLLKMQKTLLRLRP
jgi:hypothetical protein